MKRLKEWRKMLSVRTGTLLLLLAVNAAIILLLSLGTLSFYKSSFIDEIAGARSDVLRQIGERARQFKTNIYTLSNLYYSDQRFHKVAEELERDGDLGAFRAYMDAQTEQFKVSFNQVNLNFYTVYLSQNGLGYCSIPAPKNYDYMNPKIKIWYNNLYEAHGEIVDVASYRDRQLGINAFSAARTVLDSEGKIIGYLMINADERQLYKMYADVISEGSNIYVVDSSGRIVSSNRDNIIGFSYFNMENLDRMFGSENHIITKISGRDALFTRYADLESGFLVFEEIPLQLVLSPVSKVSRVVLLLALLALAAGVAMAWTFSGRVAAPLRQLCADVREVERGDLNQPFAMKSFTELNDLSAGMARMLARIRELIASVRAKEEEKLRIELNWLQAQINPHFIYNTLFSIKCAVDMGRNEMAAQMLTSFIQILRSIISTSEELVTVKAQMESLEQYVELLRLRYDNGFDAILEYDEQAAPCLLPKLLIQPLVENAILHGVDVSGGGGLITVIVRRTGDELKILVEDNGSGMSEERVREVMRPVKDRSHIGIRNVHDRIRLHFGAPWGLQVESKPGEGTQITIRVPAFEEGAFCPAETDDTALDREEDAC